MSVIAFRRPSLGNWIVNRTRSDVSRSKVVNTSFCFRWTIWTKHLFSKHLEKQAYKQNRKWDTEPCYNPPPPFFSWNMYCIIIVYFSHNRFFFYKVLYLYQIKMISYVLNCLFLGLSCVWIVTVKLRKKKKIPLKLCSRVLFICM